MRRLRDDIELGEQLIIPDQLLLLLIGEDFVLGWVLTKTTELMNWTDQFS